MFDLPSEEGVERVVVTAASVARRGRAAAGVPRGVTVPESGRGFAVGPLGAERLGGTALSARFVCCWCAPCTWASLPLSHGLRSPACASRAPLAPP